MQRLKWLFPENSRESREEISKRITWGHWFALFNIVVALLISSRYAFNADWPNTLLGKLYFFVSLFGHFSFIIFAFYLILLFPLSFIIKNSRAFRGISVIIATIGMTLILVDTEVFKRFYLHLSPLVWELLVNPEEGELARKWQLLFVPMPIILLAQMLYSRWCWNKLRSFSRQKWGKYVALFFLGCFSATHLLYAAADMSLYRPVTAQKANYPLSYPMTARSFLEKHNLIDRANFEQQLENTGRLDTFYLNYPKNTLKFKPIQQPVNMLFINLSGLSKEQISAQQMPTLFEVSQKSKVFSQHYSSANSASASIVNLFYSLSGRYLDSVLSEQKPSIFISRLQALNYQFGLFSHNGFSEPLYQRALFNGFSLPKADNNQQAIQQWQDWIKNVNKPFFSYLDLTSSELNSSMQQLDQEFGQIWQQLEQQGLLHSTLIVITSDLAEMEEQIQTNSFARQRLQVPFMLYWQGDSGRYTGLSSHLDLAPTLLLQFLGLNAPLSDYAQGIDLTKENERRWLLASDYKWNVAIMPDGSQYQIDRKGDFIYYNADGLQENHQKPPLALFLQLIQQSNQFIEK